MKIMRKTGRTGSFFLILLFNILPTAVELLVVAGIFYFKFGWEIVALMPRDLRYLRLAREEYALSASTRSGRFRGRPRLVDGTRIFSSTGTICGPSPA